MSTLKKAPVATLADGRTYTPSEEGMPPRSIAPSKLARAITIVILVFALLYFLLPIVWVLFAMTKSNPGLVSSPGFWFADSFELSQNYQKLMDWTGGLFWRWVGNSLLYSTVSAALGTLMSVAAGYGLAKFAFPGKNVTLTIIMAGLLMPVALLTIPLYIVFHSVGLVDSMWAVIIPSCVSPFGVFLGRRFQQN